jgi:hypothetical protein
VADRALDRREAQPERPLHLVHLVVHVRDLERRIDQAMKIDDLAVAGRAHAHVVDRADEINLCRDLGQRLAHRCDTLSGGVATWLVERLQRLDVGLDLDLRSELVADRFFEPGCDIVRRADRESAVDL